MPSTTTAAVFGENIAETYQPNDKAALKEILSARPIAFHSTFSKMHKSTVAGVFLSQLFYWSDKGADPDGWIYKTQADWFDETGLTRSEQETARRKLRDNEILLEKRVGNPSRLFYKVDFDKFTQKLNEFLTMLDSSMVKSSKHRMSDSSILSINIDYKDIDYKDKSAHAMQARPHDEVVEFFKAEMAKDDPSFIWNPAKYGRVIKEMLSSCNGNADEVKARALRYIDDMASDNFLKKRGFDPLSVRWQWNSLRAKSPPAQSVTDDFASRVSNVGYKAAADEHRAAEKASRQAEIRAYGDRERAKAAAAQGESKK